MSSFKILICKDNKNVVLNGKFKDYNHYNELKEKLIQNSQRPPFLEENLNLKNNEKFKIVFIREKQKDIFFPEELHDSIWDEATFIFLKKKLLIRGIKDVKYRFFLERVENYPKWKEKKKTEILNDALDKYWEEAY